MTNSLSGGRAAFLGLVQGPAELLPISSSAHLALVPWLAGWEDPGRNPAGPRGGAEEAPGASSEDRKSFEVAVHAGGAAALLIGQRERIASELRAFDGRRALVVGLSFVPPAIAGYALERQIERRLGGPRSTAIGLLAGSVAMVLADRRAQRRGPGEAVWRDGLALGVAQAAALLPGVSRNGATLAAARWREFTREQANLLSRTVALPVIVGAAALKAVRLRRRGTDRRLRRSIAIGTASAFASTLASQRLIELVERDRALWPYAVYRVALAAIVLARLRRGWDTAPDGTRSAEPEGRWQGRASRQGPAAGGMHEGGASPDRLAR